ncbi:MAG: hypothetical protein ACQESG_07940, partial [Nanobdellota archaeon]
MKFTILAMLILVGVVVNADLSDFPANMADQDVFRAQMVVGEKAAPEDFITAVNLALGLQERLRSQGSCDAQVSSGNVLMKKTGNMLESAEPIDVISPITKKQFDAFAPQVLRTDQGSFEYDQYLYMGENNSVSFDVADAIPTDESEIPSSYLIFESDAPAYEYRLAFPSPLKTKVDDGTLDLQDQKISLFGQEFQILEAKLENNKSVSLTLLAESNEDFLNEYESKTYTIGGIDYELMVVSVYNSGENEEILLRVNGGETQILEEGDTYQVEDGPVIQIKRLFIQGSGKDMALISIGPQKVKISDANITDDAYGTASYEIAGDEVKGTSVKITAEVDGDMVSITSINARWLPGRKHFLAPEQGISEILEDPDQLFLNGFDIYYAGRNEDMSLESIEVVPRGDTAYDLRFTNKLDQQLKIPLFYDDLSRFGNDDQALVATEGIPITKDDLFIVTSDGHKTLPGASGYTHLIEYDGQDASKNVLTFTDHGADKEIKVSYVDGATSASLMLNDVEYAISFTDSDNSPITVDLNNDGSIIPKTKPVLVTKYGVNIDLKTDYVVKPDPLNPTTWINYSHRQFTLYSKAKQSDIAADTLNSYLYNSVAPGVQASINNTIATLYAMGQIPYTYAITENPLTDTEPLSVAHDAIRVTVEEKDGYLDFGAIERCLDGANKKQI